MEWRVVKETISDLPPEVHEARGEYKGKSGLKALNNLLDDYVYKHCSDESCSLSKKSIDREERTSKSVNTQTYL